MNYYENFYKLFGIKNPQHLMTPLISKIDRFDFPKNSIFHFLVLDNVQYGPDSDNYLFRNITKQILMDHVLELADNKGFPKKVSVQIQPYIREYHMKHRRFRYFKDAAVGPRDENSLVVLNYGFVFKIYRYVRSIYSEYYQWWNVQKTLWQQVEAVAKSSNRQQFIFAQVPKILPSVATLNTFSENYNQQAVKFFNSDESMFLLEMWKWLGLNSRENSCLGVLSLETLNKVNIVYQDGARWMMINLGLINSWRVDKDRPDDAGIQKVKIEADQLQKRFLRLMMSFMETTAVIEEPEEQTFVEVTDETTAPDGAVIEVKEIVEDKVDENVVVDENTQILEESKLEIANKILDNLDDDLKQLEIIENKHRVDEENLNKEEVKQKVFKNKKIDLSLLGEEITPESNILKYCDDMAEDGLITASEYKGILKQAGTYKTLKSPFKPDVLLHEFMNVTAEDVKIQDSAEIPDIKSVTDKSMLKSSLLDFDERYIKDILPKNICAMVVNTQKAGIILTNYEVDQVSDVLGDYQIHTVRIKPVEGVASTIRFKLPTVTDDGVFVSNGNKYRLRRQRGD